VEYPRPHSEKPQITQMNADPHPRPCQVSLVQKPFRELICEEIAHEREGINPSPTKNSVGAGFIPARFLRILHEIHLKAHDATSHDVARRAKPEAGSRMGVRPSGDWGTPFAG